MIVLGFDTATPATAVGLRLADGSTLQARDDPSSGERPGHATRLLGLANELLAQAGVEWNALERIAVGVGPGTFTGLRIGVATARALAQSLEVDLVGVSTLQALAHNTQHAPPAKSTTPPAKSTEPPAKATMSPTKSNNVLAVIDARRGEVFVGAYSAKRQLAAPCAIVPKALGELLADLPAPKGDTSADTTWLAVGDGAVRFRSHLEELEVEVPADTSKLHRVSGISICDLALAHPAAPLETVVPEYLRRPDAELALDAGAADRQLAGEQATASQDQAARREAISASESATR